MREESNEGRRAKCKQRASTTPGHFSAANRSRWFTGELSSQWPIERRRRQTPCLGEGGGILSPPFSFFFLDRTSEQPAACVPAAPPAPAPPAATSTQRGSGARPGRLPPPQPLARYPVANSPPSFVLSTTALVPAAPHQTSHNFPTPTSPRSVPSGRERWPGPAQHAAFTAQLSFLRRPPSTPLPSAPPRSGAPRAVFLRRTGPRRLRNSFLRRSAAAYTTAAPHPESAPPGAGLSADRRERHLRP